MVNPKLFVLVFILISPLAYSNNLARDISATGDIESQSLIIPYGFYNDSTEVAAAMVFINSGYFQPQAVTLFNVFAGTNSTYSVFGALKDFQVTAFDRLFVDTTLLVSSWGELDSYQAGNPDFPDEIAGSIGSDKDNFIVAKGDDNFLRLTFKYLLPIGHGKKGAIHQFRTDRGLLVPGYEAGGDQWNPMTSGRTSFIIQPFYREQDFEDDNNNEFYNITSGIKFELEYDNSDWYVNPTKGSIMSLSVARDWGAEKESSTWTSIQFDYSKFISFGGNDNARQRTLGFNIWTSDVPTSNSYHLKGYEKIFHKAPLFEGSTLGGIDRQRGFATNRFHDRSAINYSVEYRYTPVSNPFVDMPLIEKLDIPFWQIVTFTEVGSVADNWSISDLHHKMKVSVGAGLRVSVSGLIIRIDAAGSEEGGELQMFFGHTF
ncbi:BamA/TamA family outer membrane protein [Thalassotalea nanhaiensis]|uniref:BamA/TamA family outer membrane protein n=1 Tax=Thalassotalea nanhaiensis TaxID=3065648 RepID=A0ABY9TFM2_9GAMM|nr:BamA/TamA family outer membrane protein [Colwelliaceae bacterium SQ345]